MSQAKARSPGQRKVSPDARLEGRNSVYGLRVLIVGLACSKKYLSIAHQKLSNTL